MIWYLITFAIVIFAIIFNILERKTYEKYSYYSNKLALCNCHRGRYNSDLAYKEDYLLYEKEYTKWYKRNDFYDWVKTVCFIVSIIFILFVTTITVTEHIGISVVIEKDNITYEAYCRNIEIAKSNYEDFSKTQAIVDAAHWNSDVIEYKYWAANPWTSWFFSQKRAENLKLIEY